MTEVTAAVVQMTSTDDPTRNRSEATRWIEAAVARGARVVLLPENCVYFGGEEGKFAVAESLDAPGPSLQWAAETARTHGIDLVLGGVSEQSGVPGHVHNTAFAFGPDGTLRGAYRKIHLFDVVLPDGATLRESATVAPGSEVVTVTRPWGVLGLSVCYDLRFPELYRRLASAGATVLAVPAAFTAQTGPAHWEILLRARAIENQCYVLAAAQWGTHPLGRRTHGHAMIVDPWGTVLDECPDGAGIAVATLSMEALARVRTRMPCAAHRRL